MYSVSNAYKEAIKEAVQQFNIRGNIGSISFTKENILKGSLTVQWQCSGDDELQIGSVYISELNATFLELNLDRYDYQGKIITPEIGLEVDGAYEYIPEGVYTVTEAEWSASGITVKAYDNMAKLDKAAEGLQTTGTLWQIAGMACNACGVQLANLNFNDFPNGSRAFSIYPDNDIETYRDLLSWIAQTMCCFVTANREGKIEFRKYQTEPADTLDRFHRFKGGTFADYVTRYTGLSVVNMKDQTTSYYGLTLDNGLTYNLGSNPFLQYYADDARREILNALAQLQFVPFEITGVVNPAYDIGDALMLPGGLGDGSKLFCITKRVLRYNGELRLKGAGKNPALASAKSKVDKELSGIAKSKTNDTIQFYHFTNSKRIPVADGEEKQIVDIRFTATKEARAVFHAEILLTAETTVSGITYNDAVGTVQYILNNETVEYSPKETWVDGAHILHLLYYLYVDAGSSNRLKVKLSMTGGSVVIEPSDIKACIYGQNLVATDSWDGIITSEEEAEDWNLTELVFENTQDSVTVTSQNPTIRQIADTASEFMLQILNFETVSDRLSIITHADSKQILTEDGLILFTEDGVPVYTEGE